VLGSAGPRRRAGEPSVLGSPEPRSEGRRLGQLVERAAFHPACGKGPPAEFETAYHRRLQEATEAA